MPDPCTVLPSPELLTLINVSTDAHSITITVRTSSSYARCPVCRRRSVRVHSRYTRTVADLPWQNIAVTVSLGVRRFFCGEDSCERAIFAERMPELVEHYARRTRRLEGWFTHISFALGGEAGSRLLKDLGVVVSGDTLLNHIRSRRLPSHEMPRIPDVDDFSFRRGTRFGTVLVDLERHALVDMLPDRNADTLASWLSEHPSIEVVSRNRSSEYADAIRKTLPGAAQVADRFHLLKNFGDVVLRVFNKRSVNLRSIPAPERYQNGHPARQLTRLRLDREDSRKRTRAVMRSLFRSVQALRWSGMNKSAIARTLGIHRHTVQKYAALESAPERKPRVHKVSALAPYEDYIRRRFMDGCHNATQIHKEIVEQGYPGSYKNVWRVIQYLRKCEHEGKPLPDAPPGLLATQAKGILITRPGRRTEGETLTIERMKKVDPDILKCCCLFEEFARLFRDRDRSADAVADVARGEKARTSLQQWMEGAKKSGVPELKAFAIKLSQDKEAVLQAMILPYSQGQTEGRVNKLKLIKRSMYGRGKFDLLRQRVLYASA